MKRLDSVDYRHILKLNWRMSWYGVLIWILELMVSSFVMLPWFYFVLPGAILLICGLFFSKVQTFRLKGRFKKASVTIFAQGLACSLFWFTTVALLDLAALITFDGASVSVFFLDPRNFVKYPLIILIPAIYSLVLENRSKNGRFSGEGWFTPKILRFGHF